MTRRSCCFLGTIVVALPAAGCVVDAGTFTAEGSFDRSLPVTGRVNLDVRTGSGNIRIQPGSAGTVRVVGRIRAYDGFWSDRSAAERVKRIEANPPIEQSGDSVRIGDLKDFALRHHMSISYEITVPSGTRVRSETGSGSQVIGSLDGPLETRAGSGSIRVDRIEGHVSAATGSGDIELRGAPSGVNLSTGSGSIRADAVAGPVKARTGSGRISIEGQPVQDWMLRTGSGNLTVRVPGDAAFELDAQTGSGSIESRHPIELLGSLSRKRIHGQVRGGGPLLDLSTGSGSIRIE
jgi:DUF4097 and DUF4098 domain-containing protein YvlB